MKLRLSMLLGLCLVLAMTVGGSAGEEEEHGEKVSLRDYTGSRVLLYFYPRANTSG